MQARDALVYAAAVTLSGLLVMSLIEPSWGAISSRIGTVLAIDGDARVHIEKTGRSRPLQFRDALFVQDRVESRRQSKVKVLLGDDSIWTLRGYGEMKFSDDRQPKCNLGRPKPAKKKRSWFGILNLFSGKLRVSSSKSVDAKSVAEVQTPNAVACMKGTDFVISYENGKSDITVLEGEVLVQNPNDPAASIRTVPSSFRTSISGATPPTPVVKVPPAEMQALLREVNLTEQVPREVPNLNEPPPKKNPDTETGAAKETTSSSTERKSESASTQEGTTAEAETETDAGVSPPSLALPDSVDPLRVEDGPMSQTELITPDTSPTAIEMIRKSIVEFTISFPR